MKQNNEAAANTNLHSFTVCPFCGCGTEAGAKGICRSNCYGYRKAHEARKAAAGPQLTASDIYLEW